MSEKGEFTKFEAGFTKSEKKKNKYKIQLKRHIDEKELFVAPVQPTIKGQYRSAAYQIIHPIYKSSMLTETLANCFVCSKCDHIFLHLPRNGTGPFTSHKCYKEYDTALKKAQVEAAQAKQAAAEASNKAKMAKRSVGKLHKSSETSDSSSDDDSHGSQLNSNSMRLAPVHTQAGRPPYAEVLANAIEKFVKMALNGKAVKASDIIDEIPSDFSSVSWQKFVETMEQNAPYRTKKVKVAIDRMKPDKMKAMLDGISTRKRPLESSSQSDEMHSKRPKDKSALANESMKTNQKCTSEGKKEKKKRSKPVPATTRSLRSARKD